MSKKERFLKKYIDNNNKINNNEPNTDDSDSDFDNNDDDNNDDDYTSYSSSNDNNDNIITKKLKFYKDTKNLKENNNKSSIGSTKTSPPLGEKEPLILREKDPQVLGEKDPPVNPRKGPLPKYNKQNKTNQYNLRNKFNKDKNINKKLDKDINKIHKIKDNNIIITSQSKFNKKEKIFNNKEDKHLKEDKNKDDNYNCLILKNISDKNIKKNNDKIEEIISITPNDNDTNTDDEYDPDDEDDYDDEEDDDEVPYDDDDDNDEINKKKTEEDYIYEINELNNHGKKGNFNIILSIKPDDNSIYNKNDDDKSENEDDIILTDELSSSISDNEDDYDYNKNNNNNKNKNNKNNKNKNKINKINKNDENDENIKIFNNNKLVEYLKSIEKNDCDDENILVKECLKVCEDKLKNINYKKRKKDNKYKQRNQRIFKRILRDKNIINDYEYFSKLNIQTQKKLIKELREINFNIRIDKPYRLSLLETDIPINFKSIAMKKINILRNMDPSSSEFYKIKYWVDTFMKIPFNKYKNLPVSIDDGIDICHNFMENSLNILNNAVYGLNDAKMQIMQLLGQLITNSNSIGTSIAIYGPPGSGKTSLIREGVSKILNRPFAFIALGGATDSSFLEGHSYTYEGSTWGKILQILIDSKCMNPVIYFDELDKVSDTPKGEEIISILTHLTDTSQNTQFHDKYFTEIDFDLSKCLFIFSYNDENKVNSILKDRMYRIQTKGYNLKQKVIIATNYLLPKIMSQVKFDDGAIIINDNIIQYICENYCSNEDGVRNLKRCLENIYTKINLYRLMKPNTNLFNEDISLNIEFPFNVDTQIVDKLIKNTYNNTFNQMYI